MNKSTSISSSGYSQSEYDISMDIGGMFRIESKNINVDIDKLNQSIGHKGYSKDELIDIIKRMEIRKLPSKIASGNVKKHIMVQFLRKQMRKHNKMNKK